MAKKAMIEREKKREKLVRHACRTLIKQGHAGAMSLFGFTPPEADVSPIELSTHQVCMGESLRFSVLIQSRSQQPQQLSVDYVLHMLRANGSLSLRVFKGGVISLHPAGEIEFARTHRFREVTTRRHYPGKHSVSLRINGVDPPRVDFTLVGAG